MRIKLGIPLTLREIREAIGTPLQIAPDATIKYISTDTRDLCEGDLFIALKGDRYDGEDFTDLAKSKGAYVMSRTSGFDISAPDTRDALIFLCSYYINNIRKKKYKIAISGSVGKTTTKELCKILLGTKYKVHATEGNLNNEIGMPLTVLSAPEDTEVIICEMGMNHKGEISKMSKAFQPDLAVITIIGHAHIGN